MRHMDDEISNIIQDGLHNSLSIAEMSRIACISDDVKFHYKKKPFNVTKFAFTCSILVVLYALKSPNLYSDPRTFFSELKEDYWMFSNETCLVHHSGLTIEVTRPLVKCSTLCQHLTKIPSVANMSKEYFLKHHAYTGVPVLIKNAVLSWSALNVFSFQYFRELYDNLEAYQENDDLGCQFFPYKTNIGGLKQLFHMNKNRANLEKDQWYIGWSNCVPRVMKSLRKHYERPSFLPDDSESSHLDWMFMGGSGTGADMHIDAVNRPSWQAMIRGKKTWYFEPPPECESVCKRHLNVTMEPGDILVVDTNRWYHSTYIHPGNMSITIGSEFD